MPRLAVPATLDGYAERLLRCRRGDETVAPAPRMPVHKIGHDNRPQNWTRQSVCSFLPIREANASPQGLGYLHSRSRWMRPVGAARGCAEKIPCRGGESSRLTGSPHRPRCVMQESALRVGGSGPLRYHPPTNTSGPVSEHPEQSHNRQSVSGRKGCLRDH